MCLKNNSVPEASSIYNCWQTGKFTSAQEHLDLGSVASEFRIENLPFEASGETRVLSLIDRI